MTKKRKKKNYQEILSEYLNHLSSAGNKLNSVSKEMKTQFFMNMNEMAVNKNDELKYLILMREEFFKYKLKLYYFRKWKSRALYNRDLIDEEDPFNPNNAESNYQQFKSMNYVGQGGIYDNMSSKSLNIYNSNNSGNYNGNNKDGFNNSNNKYNDVNLINFDEDEKYGGNDNPYNNPYNNSNNLFK